MREETEMEVIILRGLPGSGKTTFRNEFLRNNKSSRHCSADDFHTRQDGVYRFDPAKAGEAHATCFADFIYFMQREYKFIIVDNTNTTAVEIAPYVLGARALGYEVRILQFDVSLETSMARNTHSVPEGVIKRMYSNLFMELPPHFPKVQHI